MDPRVKHTLADRQAEFHLSMKVYRLLGDMTFDVDRINGLRLALEARAAQLPVNDPLTSRLHKAAEQVDELRKKIVATKEGGAITGEERLREFLTTLYGDLVSYEGRPSQTQVDRASSIARELGDVRSDFDAWVAKELPGINSALGAKQLPAIEILSRTDWEKTSTRVGAKSDIGAAERLRGTR
jgi:hypothetical protein